MSQEMVKKAKKEVDNASAEQLIDQGKAFYPDVDIYTNEDAMSLLVDLPGVAKGDVNINIDENNVLSIKAENTFKEPDKKSIIKNFNIGNYYRAFTIGEEFDKEKINAKIENGLLTINIPKKPEAKPKKIEINA